MDDASGMDDSSGPTRWTGNSSDVRPTSHRSMPSSMTNMSATPRAARHRAKPAGRVAARIPSSGDVASCAACPPGTPSKPAALGGPQRSGGGGIAGLPRLAGMGIPATLSSTPVRTTTSHNSSSSRSASSTASRNTRRGTITAAFVAAGNTISAGTRTTVHQCPIGSQAASSSAAPTNATRVTSGTGVDVNRSSARLVSPRRTTPRPIECPSPESRPRSNFTPRPLLPVVTDRRRARVDPVTFGR